ncbi:cytochrome c oxidase subunit II, partial [Rhizobiaceae sp. 2RAB30]
MTFFLPQAATNAAETDYLILALLLISGAILALVFGLMLLYMFKYRAGSSIDRGALAEKTWRLEVAWTSATLLIFFGLFVWGADLYVRLFRPPADAMKIYVVGKQWMWKVEHPSG